MTWPWCWWPGCRRFATREAAGLPCCASCYPVLRLVLGVERDG